MTRTQVPLKRLFESVSGGSWGVEPEEGEVVARCIRGTDFDYGALRVLEEKPPARGFTIREFIARSLRPGDLVIEKSGGGDQQPVGRTVLFDLAIDAVPTNFAGRLRPADNVEPRFACYLLSSLYADGRTRAAIKQTTGIQNLDLEALLRHRVVLPQLSEQRAIATFLDGEASRVDALIAKKRRLVKVLDERFGVWCSEHLSCTEAAGLYRTGSYPWVPLRHLASVHGGLTLGKDYPADSLAYPYLRVANVQDGRLDLREVVTIQVPESVAARHTLRPGDLLMLEGNGNPENLGRGTIWRGEVDHCLHQNHVHAVRAEQKRLMPEYLGWVVRTRWARLQFTGGSEQVSIATLSQQQIGDLSIPTPPLDVQADLVSTVDREAARVGAATHALSRQIDLLIEHRQALITAAVTGELEVPGAAA